LDNSVILIILNTLLLLFYVSFCMNRLFLLTALVASSSAALAGPFVGLNVGLSSTAYCGSYGVTDAKEQSQPMVNLSAGYAFSLGQVFAAPYAEIKTLLNRDFFSKISSISGTRTVFGGGLSLGCHLRGFSPYARIGARTQRISQAEDKRNIPVTGGNISGTFKSSAYVTGLSWGLGSNIPVSDTLCVNVNFTTTYQEQKARQMEFAGDAAAGVNPSPRTGVMSKPFKRNVSDFTVGVCYAL
jgi:hypothetical protein